jgi:hypothetical protein
MIQIVSSRKTNIRRHSEHHKFVAPANAGAQCLWRFKSLGPGFRRDDELSKGQRFSIGV